MRRLATIGLIGLGLATAAWAQSTAFPPSLLAPGEGRSAVATKCVTCHDLNRVVNRHETAAGWSRIVNDMVDDNDAELSDDDIAGITAYLAANYGPDGVGGWMSPYTLAPLDSQRAAVDALLAAAQLAPSADRGWAVAEYASPLAPDYAVFALVSATTRVVLLLPRAAASGAPRLVVAGAPDAAAFNATLGAERTLPASDAQWRQWAQLYRAIAGAPACPVPAAGTVTHLSATSVAVPCGDESLLFTNGKLVGSDRE